MRPNPDGTLDTSFNPGIGANGNTFAIAIQPDGKIIVGGEFTYFNGVPKSGIVRLNPDGSADTGFNPGLGASGAIAGVALQPNGKIIIAGDFSAYNGTARSRIARINADGSLDTSFHPGTGTDNLISTLALQPDGKIVIGGWFSIYNISVVILPHWVEA